MKKKTKAPSRNRPAEKTVLKKELEMFRRIIEGMRRELSYTDLLKLIVTGVTNGLGYDRAAIFLISPDKKALDRAVGIDSKGQFQIEEPNHHPLSSQRGFSIFSDIVHGYRKNFYTSNLLKTFPNAKWVDKGVTCNANVPIQVRRGDIIGVLAVDNLFTQRRLTQKDIASLADFATQAGMAIETVRLHERVRQLSVTDELTQLYNRRYFERFLEDEIARSARYKHPCALLYADLDRFKDINDHYGHPVGDEVLKFSANFLRTHLRNIDVVARVGGEEFAAILPETGSSEARLVAHRLVQVFSETMPPVPELQKDKRRMTLSMGVAVSHAGSRNPQALVKLADESLYAAKKAGRNRVGNLKE